MMKELPGMPPKPRLWPDFDEKPVVAVALKLGGAAELVADGGLLEALARALTHLGRTFRVTVEFELSGVGHELESNKFGLTGNVLGTARAKVYQVLGPVIDAQTGEVIYDDSLSEAARQFVADAREALGPHGSLTIEAAGRSVTIGARTCPACSHHPVAHGERGCAGTKRSGKGATLERCQCAWTPEEIVADAEAEAVAP